MTEEEPKKAKEVRQEVYRWLEAIIARPLSEREHNDLSSLLQHLAAAKASNLRKQMLILEEANRKRKAKFALKHGAKQKRKFPEV